MMLGKTFILDVKHRERIQALDLAAIHQPLVNFIDQHCLLFSAFKEILQLRERHLPYLTCQLGLLLLKIWTDSVVEKLD